MPLYDYACPSCGVFEAYGHLDERFLECACGVLAERRPFSGVPNLKGETVSRNIPDPSYRTEAQKRELNQTWGDGTKSMELLRKARREDGQGRVSVDTRGIS